MAPKSTTVATGNEAAPAVRIAIAERGPALLALIAASAEGFLMLTQDEGADAVKAGFAVVDTAIVEGDTAAVRLTDAGKATLNVAAVTARYEVDDAVPLPASASRRGRTGGYPFDVLAIGQSFHVAKTEENPDPVSRLASSVSGARLKYSEKTGETETVTVKEYQRGADGKSYVKGEDGKRVVSGEKTETRDVLKTTRDFTVKAVDATDPRGPGARVWRIA